jgi:hypothetical protein
VEVRKVKSKKKYIHYIRVPVHIYIDNVHDHEKGTTKKVYPEETQNIAIVAANSPIKTQETFFVDRVPEVSVEPPPDAVEFVELLARAIAFFWKASKVLLPFVGALIDQTIPI